MTVPQSRNVEALLRAALIALNEAGRFQVETEYGSDSYQVAAAIVRFLRPNRVRDETGAASR